MNYSQKDIAAARIIDEFADEQTKFPIETITDRLKHEGLIKVDVRAMELELARKFIQKARGLRRKNHEIQLELVNLVERTPEGKVQQYYKRVKDLNVDESVYLMNYWHKQEQRCTDQLRQYGNILLAKHGAELQLRLAFDITANAI